MDSKHTLTNGTTKNREGLVSIYLEMFSEKINQ